jgi:hypothetical protein
MAKAARISPLAISGEKEGLGEDLIDAVYERAIEIERDYIAETAKMLNRPDIAAMLERNREAALHEIENALLGVDRRRYDREFRKKTNGLYNDAILKNLGADEGIYAAALELGLLAKAAPALGKSQAMGQIVERGYKGMWDMLDRASRNARNDVIVKLRSGAYRMNTFLEREKTRHGLEMVGSGAETIDQAIRQMLGELAENGVAAYVYPSGAAIGLAPYVRRELVTGIFNANRAASFQRASEWGCDLIQASAHAGARPGCFPFQGGVYSLSGEHAKYAALADTSYGEPAGLFGINCRHFFWPFFEGLNDEYSADEKDPARLLGGPSNNDIYEATQKQRYNERQIRKWKTRGEGLKAAGLDSRPAENKVKEWQRRQRDFISRSQAQDIDIRRDYLREKT